MRFGLTKFIFYLVNIYLHKFTYHRTLGESVVSLNSKYHQ